MPEHEAVHGSTLRPQPFALNSHIPPSGNHFVPTNLFPFQRPHFFLTSSCDMGDQSEPTSFRALFESAFQAYEEKTGIALAEHPLAMELQSCHSVESMTALVQDQASAFNGFRGKEKVTKSVKSTLSILIKLSATTSLGDAVGLVCRKGHYGVFRWHL